ncbi:helix-turn-helix, Psq [Purpureocillium lilacinum]|uniref:Helix-turn-helix, Psq n=1 Tax=Purpureocillium lilacinum TaxID=33203 RepID=A0A179HJ10_PURLI|nr:helix-turn-helix, Psq [Purpureocillium lilacinum]OAQ89460.1 helix-turn-helix, Psq [Purpureocillium lilacinum]
MEPHDSDTGQPPPPPQLPPSQQQRHEEQQQPQQPLPQQKPPQPPQQQPQQQHARASSPSPTVATVEAPTIEVASQPGEEDEFDLTDDPFNDGSTSVTSSVYACTYERGRRYQCFKNGRYPIPNDDQEQDREDMKHAMLMELTDGTLFFSPVGDNPQSILDIGTGTGIWAIEVGDKYPSARVCGIDLTPIQPLWVPPNVEFLVDDCEQDWLVRNVDLVHFRFMAVILKDISIVMEHAYECLRPGGWIEFQELMGVPSCDDGTMPEDDPFVRLYATAGKAWAKLGLSTTIAARLEPYLRDAGFTNVHCKVLKVPIGVWAKDKTMRLIGLYQKRAVDEFISTFAGRPFEALGLDPTAVQIDLALARQSIDDISVHRYFPYYFWYAQKPASPADYGT